MTWQSLPWAEMTVLVPLAGALVVAFLRDYAVAARWSLVVTLTTLACSLLAVMAMKTGNSAEINPLYERFGEPLFTVDAFSAPLLPLVALLHALTVLATAKSKESRLPFLWLLIAEAVQLAAFSSPMSELLVVLLALEAVPPLIDLLRRGKPLRVYVLHMTLYVVLLSTGWLGWNAGHEWGSVAILGAVLVRCGTVPAHLWVADLFEHTSFGSALMFVTPLTGVYVAVRLALPTAPVWALQVVSMVSLVTAVYGAGMAVVVRDGRRFFAYLFLSQTSLVLVGLELHTTISLTGALCLWLSVPLSLGGLGLTMRALEARCGRLSLTGHHGLYEQTPALAGAFLLGGLASVGFPGTVGFVAAELLDDVAVKASPIVGVGLILASAINGVAVLRVYYLLFTGRRHAASVPLNITAKERIAVLVLTALLLGGGLFPQPGIADRYAVADAIKNGHKPGATPEEVAPPPQPREEGASL